MLKRDFLSTLVAGSLTTLPLLSEAQVIVRIAPPELRVEAAPAPRRGYEWVPGRWDYRRGRYVWADGYWLRARAGHRWQHDRWVERNGRWYQERGRWVRGDRDRDGVPNRVDRDRDGDGVRNNRDRAPDNSRRN